jgi:hypothetical protein
MTSTGVAALTVPVHGYGAKIATRDVRIDNSRRWQHTHWMSIVSGYRNSPFFEHYEWRFAPVYERRFEFLVDLDLELLSIVAPLLGLESIERIGAIAGYGATATSGAITISESWVEARPGDIDLRGKKALRRPTPPSYPATQPSGPVSHNSPHHPHHPHHPHAHEYTQVFSDRQPFVAGLSIVDLLFNEGPAARVFLELQ